jgi:hypothetical protein
MLLNDLRFFCRKAASFNVLYHSLLGLASPQQVSGSLAGDGDNSLK